MIRLHQLDDRSTPVALDVRFGAAWVAHPLVDRPVLNLRLLSLRQLLVARNPGVDPEQLVIEHLASQLGVQATGLGVDRQALPK